MANEQKRNEGLDFDVPENHNCLQSSRPRPTDRPRLLFRNLRIQSIKYPSSIRRLLGTYSPRLIPALHGIDGVLLEGESLLVLGRPGSGCSTFLKTLGACSSEFQVSGVSATEFYVDAPKGCIYTAEEDAHFAELTVRETIRTAVKAMSPGSNTGEANETYIEHILRTFKLSSCADTRVGNSLIRGVSGGERRRVTLAESLIRGASVHSWDNSTRGMDSSTALAIITTITDLARSNKSTAIVSVYQASQAIFKCFTKVLLLHEGRQAFFGRSEEAEDYFFRMGFCRPAPTTSTADFLTSLTHSAEAREMVQNGHQGRTPRTAKHFEDRWRNSQEHKDLLNYMSLVENDLNKHCNQAKQESDFHMLPASSQILLCLHRGVYRLRSNLEAPVSAIIANGVLGLILGSLFYNLDDTTNSFYGRSVLLFYATMLNGFMSGFEVIAIWAQRPIVEKHRELKFYEPVAEAGIPQNPNEQTLCSGTDCALSVSAMLCDLPNKVLSSLVFNLPMYFLANLRRAPEAFFTFFLFSFTCLLTMSMLFRSIGSICNSFAQTFVPVGGLVFLCVIYSGFVIPHSYMHPWLMWFSYINPTSYTLESLMLNEFAARNFQCHDLMPTGPGYGHVTGVRHTCTAVGSEPGQSTVSGTRYIELAFSYRLAQKWRNLGILFAMMAILCVSHLVLAQYRHRIFSRENSKKSYKTEGVNIKEADEEQRRDRDSEVLESQLLPVGLQEQTSTLSWENVTFTLSSSKKKDSREILHGIDGWIKPKTLTALMGVTGAGKTTLLDALASRTTVGIVSGDVFVDGKPRAADFRRETGYSQQNDIHLATATVKEALQFSARLRQPRYISEAHKMEYVDEVIQVLGLELCSNHLIGSDGAGINVHERKKLTIGIELVAKPKVLLFLDEPTSGLDSQTAWSICTLLRRLANNGQTILCTLHQPSAKLLHMFDRLLLISAGHTLYFGDIGLQGRTISAYFEKQGARSRAVDETLAEWMMEITSEDAPGESWAARWKASMEYTRLQEELFSMRTPSAYSGPSSTAEYAASQLQQFLVLTRRTFQEALRTPSYMRGRLLFYTSVAALIGFSFWDSPSSLQGLQNQLFSIFFLLSTFSVVMQQLIPQFIQRRRLFEARERPSKTYSWQAFLLSSLAVELVIQTVMSALIFPIFYYPIGMYRNATGAQQSERAALMFLLTWALMLFTPTLSFAVAAAIEDSETAVNIVQLLFLLITIFCGILVPSTDLSTFWKFMYHVSPFTYLVASMFAAAVANTSVMCAPVELLSVEPPTGSTCAEYLSNFINAAGGSLVNPEASSACNYCPALETNSILARFNISYEARWRGFFLQWIYLAVNVAAMTGLYWLARVWPHAKAVHNR